MFTKSDPLHVAIEGPLKEDPCPFCHPLNALPHEHWRGRQIDLDIEYVGIDREDAFLGVMILTLRKAAELIEHSKDIPSQIRSCFEYAP